MNTFVGHISYFDLLA